MWHQFELIVMPSEEDKKRAKKHKKNQSFNA